MHDQKPKSTAMCCRAMMLESGEALVGVRRLARVAFTNARKGDQVSKENLALLSHLELLPRLLSEWPQDSRDAIGSTWEEGRAYWRCKALGPDGLCSIYDRRPGTCRKFSPHPENGCERCASYGSTCPTHIPAGCITAKADIEAFEPFQGGLIRVGDEIPLDSMGILA